MIQAIKDLTCIHGKGLGAKHVHCHWLLWLSSLLQVTDNPSEVAVRAPPRNSPRFAGFMNVGGESSYFIFVEQKVLYQISSFSKALLVWFCVHYIFNLEYCKQAKDVALFFQEYVFGMPDRSKKSATYLTVCSDIQSYTSCLLLPASLLTVFGTSVDNWVIYMCVQNIAQPFLDLLLYWH